MVIEINHTLTLLELQKEEGFIVCLFPYSSFLVERIAIIMASFLTSIALLWSNGWKFKGHTVNSLLIFLPLLLIFTEVLIAF